MATIPVRLAQPSDIPQLVTLMTEFYAEAGLTLELKAATRTFDQLIREPRLGKVWVLEHEAQPAGYVVLTVSFSMEYGGLRGFVDDLFVRAPLRGRGLGTAALTELRHTCETLGIRALLVEVGPDNPRAQSVYGRAGFKDSARLLFSLPLGAPVHTT